jgi:hypothetical protein
MICSAYRLSGYKIKKMTGHVACNGRRDVITGIWWENHRQRGELKGLDIGGMIILKYISKKWDGVMGWVELAQDLEGLRRAVERSVVRSVGQVRTASDSAVSEVHSLNLERRYVINMCKLQYLGTFVESRPVETRQRCGALR